MPVPNLVRISQFDLFIGTVPGACAVHPASVGKCSGAPETLGSYDLEVNLENPTSIAGEIR